MSLAPVVPFAIMLVGLILFAIGADGLCAVLFR